MPPRLLASLPLASLSLSSLLLAGLVAAPEARAQTAQSFFEQLFGIKPRPAPVPPAPVPGGRGGYGYGDPSPAPSPGAVEPSEGPRVAPPAPPKPVAVRAPNDADAVGRDFLQNGSTGSLRLDRAGTGMTAKITLAGSKISRPTEACSIPLGGGQAMTLVDRGRPDGVTRLEVSEEACPLRLDILDGAVLATLGNETDICTFAAADCQAEPKGLWGPAAAPLLPRAGEFEGARGPADKAVRDNYRILGQRAGSAGIRPVVAEQAAFSSDREQVCRSYAREAVHGFCHLRFTEARGLSLATRLGVGPATTAATSAATPRTRRRGPVESSVLDE